MSSLFVVQGGKTQGTTGGGYTYTSGPNSADFLALDLSKEFSAGASSSPPWMAIGPTGGNTAIDAASNNTPAAVSFATLSPISTSSLMLFGGDGSPQVPIQTRNDSLYFIDLIAPSGSDANYSASWRRGDDSWSQPMRRVYASSESASDGRYWLVGGERADGSGIVLPESWTVDTSSGNHHFAALEAPPGSLVGHTSTFLNDGTLLLLGGQDASGQLQSLESVNAYDTKKNAWRNVSTTSSSGNSPRPRRGHVAVSLPSQRIFLHGGAPDAAMTTALDDAWILDWSHNPPRWSQIAADAEQPSGRFGHSAVAYGRKVAMTFGWTGSNPADTGIYIFDATKLSMSSDGTVSGAQWSPTYSPDPDVKKGNSVGSGSGSGSSSTNNPDGNGSSTSSGGGSGGKGDSSDSGPSFGSPTDGQNGNGGDGNTGGGNSGDGRKDDGPGGAAKAGAVIGAFVAVGLVVAGGYAAYHKYEQRRLTAWRHGDGSRALLGVADMEGGGGGYSNEKAYGQYAAGTRPAGPRSWGRAAGAAATERPIERYGDVVGAQPRDMEMANVAGIRREPTVVPIWSPNAVGHAIEGPGPRMRDRLAMLTGLTGWAPQSQPRFDMLADEDDFEGNRPRDDRLQASNVPRSRVDPHYYRRSLEDDGNEENEDILGDHEHVREHSYGRVGRFDPADRDAHSEAASLASEDRASMDDPFTSSPFEDDGGHVARPVGPRSFGSRSGVGLLAAAGAALGVSSAGRSRLGSDDGHSSNSGHVDSIMANSAPSDQTHRSRAMSSAKSVAEGDSMTSSAGDSSGNNSSTRGAGLVSFSDAPYHDGRRGSFSRGGSAGPALDGPRISDSMGSMHRSPTWWGRIMGNLERTSSGRFTNTPGANNPIRDPAPPPALNLSTIKESPRSVEPSEDDPFADVIRVHNPSSTNSSLARHATVSVGGMGAYDELGRKRHRGNEVEEMQDDSQGAIDSAGYAQHGRSQSSLQSMRTTTSSYLEAQLRGMDVVQRTRTISSRRTTSTRRTGSHNTSEPGSLSSRMGSLHEPGLAEEVEPSQEETPGQIVWQPRDWHTSARSPPPPSAGMPLSSMPELSSDLDESMDIVAQQGQNDSDQSQELTETSLVHSPVELACGGPDGRAYLPPFESEAPEYAAARHWRGTAIPREASEVPSITPATTKRARLNPLLISPVNPQPKRTREAPLTGSVRDRVKEIERKRSADPSLLPSLPESALPQSPTKKARIGGQASTLREGLQPLDTSAHILGHASASTSSMDAEPEGKRAMMSPLRITSPLSAGAGPTDNPGSKKVQHGLVPRAHISIANPDDVD